MSFSWDHFFWLVDGGGALIYALYLSYKRGVARGRKLQGEDDAMEYGDLRHDAVQEATARGERRGKMLAADELLRWAKTQ